MSWLAVAGLCTAAYALKLLGAVVARHPSVANGDGSQLDALAVPVLAGLIVVQTLGQDRAIVFDGRLAALALAALLIWRGAPLLVVALAAGACAAVLHQTGL